MKRQYFKTLNFTAQIQLCYGRIEKVFICSHDSKIKGFDRADARFNGNWLALKRGEHSDYSAAILVEIEGLRLDAPVLVDLEH